MFCDKCGCIGVPVDGMVMCRDCGRVIANPKIEKKQFSNKLTLDNKIPEVIGSAFFNCPRCKCIKGEHYEIPPQYGDEESAFFVKCSNCGFSKKEEGTKTS
ncbi:MAG: hypothetical protein GON13_00340 [Nanoarchaeota archaeon]|nr:hypothetical protein [Nanoarchaeota archaeon]